MTKKTVISSRIFAGLMFVLCAGVSAQEGHPYEGTWRGSITMATDVPVVMIVDFDGENLQGIINPGRNSYNFLTVAHDAPNWTLTVTAATRVGEEISFTGVMHDIGSVNRVIEGTWEQGGKDYPFKISRE